MKSVANNFNWKPFYLIQSNGNEKRYVTSFANALEIKSFVRWFICSAAADIEIKIRDLEDSNNPVEFYGKAAIPSLLDLIDKYEEVIFHDGFNEIMLRNSDAGDYVAIDEHGLLFIYTDDDYSDVLTKFGLPCMPDEKLIYQTNHWHKRPANAKTELSELIADLLLE